MESKATLQAELLKSMSNKWLDELYYMLIAQKVIENDVLKVAALRIRKFRGFRNFCIRDLAQMGGKRF